MVYSFLEKIFRIVRKLEVFFDKIDEIDNGKLAIILFLIIFFGVIGGKVLGLIGVPVYSAVILFLYVSVPFYPFFKKWRSSVIRFFLICLIYNLILTAFISLIIDKANLHLSPIIYIFVYGILWITVSIIAEPDVAVFVNEIVSCICAAVFTIGSFCLSRFNAESIIESINAFDKMNETELENNLPQLRSLLLNFLGGSALSMICYIMLPLIGISALGLTASKIKQRWEIKHAV